MRRAIAWLIDGLPFDPRSRRALDETMLDWAHEQGSAPTFGRRAVVEIGALMSIARAAVGAVVGDVVRTPWGPLAVRASLVLSVSFVALISISYALTRPDFRAAAGTAVAIQMSTLETLHELELLLPVLIFFAWAWPGHGGHRPTVGAALMLLFGTLILTLGMEPWMQGRYADIATPAWRQLYPGSTYHIAGRGTSELFSEIRSTPGGVVFSAVGFKIGLAILAAGLSLLAAVIRDGRLGFGRRWLVVSPLMYLGVFKLAATGYLFEYFLPQTILGNVSSMLMVIVMLVAFARAVRARQWPLVVPGTLALLGFVALPVEYLLLFRALVSGPLPALLGLTAVALAVSVRQSGAEPRVTHA